MPSHVQHPVSTGGIRTRPIRPIAIRARTIRARAVCARTIRAVHRRVRRIQQRRRL